MVTESYIQHAKLLLSHMHCATHILPSRRGLLSVLTGTIQIGHLSVVVNSRSRRVSMRSMRLAEMLGGVKTTNLGLRLRLSRFNDEEKNMLYPNRPRASR
jgi:hypothetical protein